MSKDAAQTETDPLPTRRSLLSHIKNWNDEASWREFTNTYWRLIYNTARRRGLSESDAEDVTQEVLVVVAQRMRDFKYDPARGSFKGWLRTLTANLSVNRHRKRGREVPTVALAARNDTSTDPLAALPDPASLEADPRWEEEWEANLLRAALDRVQCQAAAATFQMYDFHVLQGQTVGQTCAALGVSAAKVYLAKLRIGRMLKREVARLREELW